MVLLNCTLRRFQLSARKVKTASLEITNTTRGVLLALLDTSQNRLFIGIPDLLSLWCAYIQLLTLLVLLQSLQQSPLFPVSQTVQPRTSQLSQPFSIETLDHETLLRNVVYRELYHRCLGAEAKLDASR